MRKILLVLAMVAVGACAKQSGTPKMSASASGGEARKPNVIVILADDLGYADVGAQNISKDVKTPNIDSIAAAGVRFTNGYVSCPVCSPTRAGFLTGRYQQRFGHEFNPGGNRPEDFGMPLDQITIANVMKSAGYTTGLVGKWHQGTMPGYYPTDRGFDEFFGFLGGAHKYLNLKAEGKTSIIRGKEPVDEKEYLTDALSREAVSFVQRHKDAPFFLYVAYNAVHVPQDTTKKYFDRFPNESDPKRRNMLAMLSAEDDGIGRVLETLRKNNLERDTLVVFFSDNGGPTPGNGSRNTPLSGYKGQVWEGGIRIPFMAQWKGKIPEGKVLEQPVIAPDLFATAAAAGNASVPTDRVMDGKNLLPLMTGGTMAAPHDALYWRYGPQAAIRCGPYKLVMFRDQPDKLFDLVADVSEKNDLAAQKPQVAKELRSKWDRWSAELMAPRWKNKPKVEGNVEADAQQKSKTEVRANRAAKRKGRQSPATQPQR